MTADWVDAEGRRVATYTRLPPGTYRFQVEALDREGRWVEPGAGAGGEAAAVVLPDGVVLRAVRARAWAAWRRAATPGAWAGSSSASAGCRRAWRSAPRSWPGPTRSWMPTCARCAPPRPSSSRRGRWRRWARWPRAWGTRSTTRSPTSSPTWSTPARRRRRWRGWRRRRAAARAAAGHAAGAARGAAWAPTGCGASCQDLKTFSRQDEDARGPVDLQAVMDSAAKMAAGELRPRAQLVRDYAADVPPVEGNEARLAQVFLNLHHQRGPGAAGGQARAERGPARPEARTATGRWWPRCGTRARHSARGARPHLRSVLHHQAGGRGHGAGAGAVPRVHHLAWAGASRWRARWGKGTVFRVTLPAASGRTQRAAAGAEPGSGAAARAREAGCWWWMMIRW